MHRPHGLGRVGQRGTLEFLGRGWKQLAGHEKVLGLLAC